MNGMDDFELHCFNTEKIYDWFTSKLEDEVHYYLPFRRTVLTDEFCGNFLITAENPIAVVYSNKMKINVTGTLSVYTSNANTGTYEVQVNRASQPQRNGIQFTQTFSSLNEVRLLLTDPSVTVKGRYCITLHYLLGPPAPICEEVSCYLVDDQERRAGIDSIACEEIGEREELEITLPSGEVTTTYRVTLLKSGCLRIKVRGRECTLPINIKEQVLLCAPPGTIVSCEITDFSCYPQKVIRYSNCWRFDIRVEICQQIQASFPVSIRVPSRLCNPRTSDTLSFFHQKG
ncbi:S-Ena type endospore appendage [Sutcliffiella horikoshii]|uniref:S-Ena type endospore appendage n=1 Tax=Sutcliffiella horikoshii TaxID=79883 RepID=UPI0038517974